MTDVHVTHRQESPAAEIPECWRLEPAVTKSNTGVRDGWKFYWEELRDNQQIFREQSDDYVRNLESTIELDPNAVVLDFGCGFGFVAEMLSPLVGELFLWDASANMRRRARVKVAGCRNIRFLDLSDSQASPRDLRFDLILVNSVVQYMTLDEFSAWLLRWRQMLAPAGRIVVSDLIPPDYPAVWDFVDLLRFSARRGFLARAIWEALGEIFSYLSVRQARPLTRIGREELRQRGKAAGLAVHYLPCNLAFFTKRITAVFTQADHC
jgi:SAM-dependent methyltransferase